MRIEDFGDFSFFVGLAVIIYVAFRYKTVREINARLREGEQSPGEWQFLRPWLFGE